MTREELTSQLLHAKEDNYLLELSTGFGKTRLTLDKIKQWYTKSCKILVCVPKLVLITNFIDECKKWDCEYMLKNITFTTYASFHKHTGIWDIVILDEAHHLSERCRDIMSAGYSTKHILALSATMKKEHKNFLNYYFYRRKQTYRVFEVKLTDAIDSKVLPKPTIILFPLELNNVVYDHEIKKNFKNTKLKPLTVAYKDKFKYKSYKGPLIVKCTARQYYNDLSSLIDWYKQRADSSRAMRNLWLHKCGERLAWLAEKKTSLVKTLLLLIRNYRTITFCSRIEESEKLGVACVNSKIGTENLDKFNNKKIKHIAAVAQLDEGINLVDCKIGVFQMINSSTRLIAQRLGRLERHKEPILIFPYFKFTREEEIVNNIVNDYDKVFKIDNINEVLGILKKK